MGLVVNTNIASINAQRQLSSSGADLDQASERLASGKRINSAADDAAGLAIANRQTSQIRGLDQAIRNANDGISLIQTAEGALDATSNILQRVRELSVQSANGIYSDNDRATLDAEVKQLTSELDRIAGSTSFNGQNILDGSLGTLKLQVGAEAGDTIDLTVQGFSAAELGGAEGGGDVVGAAATGSLVTALAVIDGAAATQNMNINGQNVGDLSAATNTLADQLAIINASVTGVETTAFVEGTLGTASASGNGILTGGNRLSFAILGQDGSTTTVQIGNTGSVKEIADKLNDQAGSLVQASVNDQGRLELNSTSATTITVADAGSGGTGTSLTALGSASASTTNALQARLSFEITSGEPGLVENAAVGGTPTVNSVDITYTSTTTNATATQIAAIGVQARTDGDVSGGAVTTDTSLAAGDLVINGVAIGAVANNSTAATQAASAVAAINLQTEATGVVASLVNSDEINLNSVDGSEISIAFAETNAAVGTATGLIETNSSNSQGSSVDDINISTQAGATAAIEVVDLALEQINSQRADLGAINNRLDFTVSNLSNVSENTSAARSRIMDADFASETAELSRAQVLQQASQAILAQANARPQQVLSLLN
jgi:flagellin